MVHYPAGSKITHSFLEFQRHGSQKHINIAGQQIMEISTLHIQRESNIWFRTEIILLTWAVSACLSFRLGNV
jgi:hypothetical protein